MGFSRSKNLALNIYFGYLAQIGILILSFIGRKIFLKYLSVDYLGINGLYSNILIVLSLAELGFDTAVVYSLYKPVAENNIPLINSLLRYFRKIYSSLALIIFMLGIAIIPFLRFIIQSNLNQRDLILYYILFLINTVVSYLVAHKVALLSAYQEQRIQKLVLLTSNFILQLIHIIVLIIWGNYYIYIIATVISTVINNIILNFICNRRHAYLKDRTQQVAFDKKPINKKIFSSFVYKVGAVAINNTDNILISMLVSTAAVGLYSNYYTVISAIQGFIVIISTSLISGVGNLGANGDKKRQYEIFNIALLFYHLIAALGLTGFGLLFNDVITLWLGDMYLFDIKTVFIIALNFYLTNAVAPIWMYREANGFFEQVRYLMLVRAGINIVLSIILGILFGTFGILAATAISLLVTSFWYEPAILYKNVFGISQKYYWLKQTKCFLTTFVGFGLSMVIVSFIPSGFFTLIIKTIIIVSVISASFLISTFRSNEIRMIFDILKLKRH